MSEFTPVTKGSTSVKDDLRLAASDRKLSIDQIDFDLLSYETHYKKRDDEEWQTMSGDNILKPITQEELYSSDFLLNQKYQIRIRAFTPHPYLDLHFSVAISKTSGLVSAIIDPSSVIPLKKGVKEFKKRVMEAKQTGLEPMKADVVRLKQYQEEAYRLNEDVAKLREDENYLEALHDTLEKFYEADLQGEVVYHGSYNGLDRVVFVDTKTREEYSVLPVGEVKRIGLELYGERKKILLEH